MSKTIIIFLSGLILLFYLSVKLTLYNYFKSYLGIHDSYLLDQLLFLLAFFAILSYHFFSEWKEIFSYRNLLNLTITTLSFAAYFIFLLNFQSEILDRYFIKDDQFVLLPALLREDALDYRYSNKLDYFYYHFGAAVLLFKFFHLNTYYYNVFTLATLALACVVFLKLLNHLNLIHGVKNFWIKILVVIVTLLFLVSPSIMDSFVYIEHSAAIGYIATGVTLSIYLYFLFLEKRRVTYFLLSFILMLFLLKTSLTRSGFLPALLILLEIFHLLRNRKGLMSFTLRCILLLTPFLIIAKPYILPSSSGRLYGISLDRFINLDRIYLFFGNVIPAFMPFQFMSPFFRSIRALVLGEFNIPTTNFILNHMLFVSGIIFTVSTLAISLTLLFKMNVRFVLYFWFAFVGSLLFYILFGNVIENGLPPPHVFDHSLLSYGTVPGSRYYPLPLIFVLTMLYLLLISTLNFFGTKTKKVVLGVTTIILAFTVWSNINFTQEVNHGANEGIVTVRIITEKVLDMVPDNKEKKVIYSTNGRINDIEYIIRGFHGFFKYDAPEYFWNEEELLTYLATNQIAKDNFFAFNFDRKTMNVEDSSEKARNRFKNYLADNQKTP